MTRHPWFSHLLVALQFGSIALVVFPFAGLQNAWWWLAISVLGGVIGIYTLMHNRLGNFAVYPEPLQQGQLITSGPYRWVRHPMYLSLLLGMLGVALVNGHWLNWLGMLILLLAIQGKMHFEEGYLTRKFADYAAYVKRSKRLLPYVY